MHQETYRCLLIILELSPQSMWHITDEMRGKEVCENMHQIKFKIHLIGRKLLVLILHQDEETHPFIWCMTLSNVITNVLTDYFPLFQHENKRRNIRVYLKYANNFQIDSKSFLCMPILAGGMCWPHVSNSSKLYL